MSKLHSKLSCFSTLLAKKFESKAKGSTISWPGKRIYTNILNLQWPFCFAWPTSIHMYEWGGSILWIPWNGTWDHRSAQCYAARCPSNLGKSNGWKHQPTGHTVKSRFTKVGCCTGNPFWFTLQGINISHLGKRKIIFKMPFLGDMLVP